MIERDRFYSVREFQVETRAPRSLVYSALEDGSLRALRRGRRWLIPGSSAITWLEGVIETNGTHLPQETDAGQMD